MSLKMSLFEIMLRAKNMKNEAFVSLFHMVTHMTENYIYENT